MITDFVSVTELQKNSKGVLHSGKPFQLILSNNKLQGAVLSADVVKYMADSGLLTQIQEELWELQDKVTRNVVQQSRFSNKKMVSLKSFRKKYGI